MLRRLVVSFKNSIVQKHIPPLSKSITNPLVASFSSSNISTKQTPFKQYKNTHQQKIVYQREDNPVDKPQKLPSITDKALEDFVSACGHHTSQPNSQYNEDALNIVVQKLWSTYLGIYTDLIAQEKRKNPNAKQLSLVYLSNKVLQNQDFVKVASQLNEIYRLNQNTISRNPRHYIKASKFYAKFETFHENKNFGEVICNITEELISQKYPDMNAMASLLKTLAAHSYYCRVQKTNSKFASDITKRLEIVQEVERKLFAYLMDNKGNIGFLTWVGILTQLKVTHDELAPLVFNHVHEKLKDASDLSQIPQCLAKVGKLVDDSSFSDMFLTMKELVLEQASQNKLDIEKISFVVRAFTQNDENVSESEFNAIWRNFEYNMKQNKLEGTPFFSVSSLLNSLTSSKYFSQDKFELLQECAVLVLDNALRNGNAQPESLNDQSDEEVESREDRVQGKNIESSLLLESIRILKDFAQRDVVKGKGINCELLKRMFKIMEDNSHKIARGKSVDIIHSRTMILEKLRCDESVPPEIIEEVAAKSATIYKKLGNQFLKQINGAGSVDVVKVFRSLCFTGDMDENKYQIFVGRITQKISNFSAINYMLLLEGIAHLKDLRTKLDTETLEKALIDKVIQGIKSCPKDAFIGLANLLHKLKGLTYISELSKGFENQTMQLIKQCSLKEISFMIYSLYLAETVSQEFLEMAAPFIISKMNKASTRNLFYLVDVYTKSNCCPPDLFETMEKALLRMIKEEKMGRIANKLEFQEFGFIFNDLAKYQIKNHELINEFEALFERRLADLGTVEKVHIINCMGIYQSQNLSFLKALLTIVEEDLKIEANRKIYLAETPNLSIQSFHQAIFTIELEYREHINLSEYPEIYKLYCYFNENIESVRFSKIESSHYHNSILKDLKAMGYDAQGEYIVGIYIADIFIKPNLILEFNGPMHYIDRTKTMVLKSQKKTRQLKKLGYEVVIVPHYEWEEIKSFESRGSYIQNKINISQGSTST